MVTRTKGRHERKRTLDRSKGRWLGSIKIGPNGV